MGTFFCTECGYESFEEKESICPHCNIPMEKLEYKDEMSESDEIYPEKVMKNLGDDENPDIDGVLPDEELSLNEKEEEI